MVALVLFVALVVFVASVVALVRPIPKIYLGTRRRAAIGLIGSIVLMAAMEEAREEKDVNQQVAQSPEPEPEPVPELPPATPEPEPESPPAPKLPPEPEPPKLSATDYHTAYEENEISADEKYKGKKLILIGVVKEIKSGGWGGGRVHLEVDDEFGLSAVVCNFEKNQKSSLSSLRPGQRVAILGKGDGRQMGVGYPQIEKSRVLEVASP